MLEPHDGVFVTAFDRSSNIMQLETCAFYLYSYKPHYTLLKLGGIFAHLPIKIKKEKRGAIRCHCQSELVARPCQEQRERT